MAFVSSTGIDRASSDRDPIDTCHFATDRFHEFLESGDPSARGDVVAMARGLLDAGRIVTLGGSSCLIVPHFDQVEVGGWQMLHTRVGFGVGEREMFGFMPR